LYISGLELSRKALRTYQRLPAVVAFALQKIMSWKLLCAWFGKEYKRNSKWAKQRANCTPEYGFGTPTLCHLMAQDNTGDVNCR